MYARRRPAKTPIANVVARIIAPHSYHIVIAVWSTKQAELRRIEKNCYVAGQVRVCPRNY